MANNYPTCHCCNERVNPEDDDTTIILDSEEKSGFYYLCGECFDDRAGRDKVVKCCKCQEWIDGLERQCPNCKEEC